MRAFGQFRHGAISTGASGKYSPSNQQWARGAGFGYPRELLLEYDTERAGGFEPLWFVASDETVARPGCPKEPCSERRRRCCGAPMSLSLRANGAACTQHPVRLRLESQPVGTG